MQSIPATDARANFADLLRRVSAAKERIVIERRGRPAVAMVPVEDLEAIDGLMAAGLVADDLRASEAVLARAQRIARIGSWRWSIERNELVSCSDEYARVHGVAPDEIHALMAEQMERVIHP
ncbi:MAG: type II toxin-antitoxin system Phd/YefM family antitoxin, partial [Proteobacteria bacterium]|nr:type II toxin-antitoxin system Phd/YefM family antitoxin [Pseudomonadota bacterium]